jgi:hypothetical protein
MRGVGLAGLAWLVAMIAAACGGSTKTVTVTTPGPATTVTATTSVTVTAPASGTTSQSGVAPGIKTMTSANTATVPGVNGGYPLPNGPPTPLGQAADIGQGFTMKVVSASSTTANAAQGAQWETVVVELAYHGTGQATPPLTFGEGRVIFAAGKHKAVYRAQSCPRPTPGVSIGLETPGQLPIVMFAGTRRLAHVCFEVAVADVATLNMYLWSFGSPGLPSVGFALRSG